MEKNSPSVDPYAAKHMLFKQNSSVSLEVRGLLMSGNWKPATLVRLSRQCDFTGLESFDCNLYRLPSCFLSKPLLHMLAKCAELP